MPNAIITGGNSGIGLATGLLLARSGYCLCIQGRNEEKCQEAVRQLTAAGAARVSYVAADISSVGSMKETATRLAATFEQVDVLILSTGTLSQKRHATADGLEVIFATQFLARFATANEVASRMPAGGKIISVGAAALPFSKIHWQAPGLTKNFTMPRAMQQSLLANYLMVQGLATRHPHLQVNMINAGISMSGIARHLHPFLRFIYSLLAAPPHKAAANALFLATHPAATFSGYYLGKPGNPQKKKRITHKPAEVDRLWLLAHDLLTRQ